MDPSPSPVDVTDDEAFSEELNTLLVSTFRSVERYEGRCLRSFYGMGLSISDAHVIDAVGRGAATCPDGVTVTAVAETLGVRNPTATAAVNRLVAKGLLLKERSTGDLRSVNVRLTRDGRRAFRLHRLFHRRMVDAVAGTLPPQERSILASGIRRLKAFFEDTANGGATDAPVVHNGQDQTAGDKPRGKLED